MHRAGWARCRCTPLRWPTRCAVVDTRLEQDRPTWPLTVHPPHTHPNTQRPHAASLLPATTPQPWRCTLARRGTHRTRVQRVGSEGVQFGGERVVGGAVQDAREGHHLLAAGLLLGQLVCAVHDEVLRAGEQGQECGSGEQGGQPLGKAGSVASWSPAKHAQVAHTVCKAHCWQAAVRRVAPTWKLV